MAIISIAVAAAAISVSLPKDDRMGLQFALQLLLASFLLSMLGLAIGLCVSYAQFKRGRRRNILGAWLSQGTVLLRRPVGTEEEFRLFEKDANQWFVTTSQWIEKNLGIAEAATFQADYRDIPVNFGGAYNDTHNGLLNSVNRSMRNLTAIISRY